MLLETCFFYYFWKIQLGTQFRHPELTFPACELNIQAPWASPAAACISWEVPQSPSSGHHTCRTSLGSSRWAGHPCLGCSSSVHRRSGGPPRRRPGRPGVEWGCLGLSKRHHCSLSVWEWGWGVIMKNNYCTAELHELFFCRSVKHALSTMRLKKKLSFFSPSIGKSVAMTSFFHMVVHLASRSETCCPALLPCPPRGVVDASYWGALLQWSAAVWVLHSERSFPRLSFP